MTDEDFDPTAAFDMEQDALQKQLLMAQALRRQPKAVGMQGGFGKALRSLTGQVGEWKAQAGLQDLAEQRRTTVSPQHRLELSLKKANLGKMQTEEAFANAPAADTYHQNAKIFGVTLPPNATNRQAAQLLEMAKSAYVARQHAIAARANAQPQPQPHERIGDASGAQFWGDPRNPTRPLVPIVNPADGSPITKPDPNAEKKKEQIREIEERHNNALRALTRMEEQVKATGTFELFGAGQPNLEGDISDWATDMAKLKDPTSSAQQGEVDREKRGLFQPGLFTGPTEGSALEIIKAKKEALKERRKEAYRVRGLEVPAGDGQQPAAPSAGTPGAPMQDAGAAPPGMKWQKNKKTGERRLVPIGG